MLAGAVDDFLTGTLDLAFADCDWVSGRLVRRLPLGGCGVGG